MTNGEIESKRRYSRWFRSTPEGKAARAKQAADYRARDPERAKLIKIKCRMLKRYGITYEQYKEMLVRQGGRCALCGSKSHGGPKTAKHFNVDHDHVTGKVRGLLCFRCNAILGQLGDTAEAVAAWAKSAAEYLKCSKQGSI